MRLEVVGAEFMEGMEGLGFKVLLSFDGRTIGTAIDDADGSPVHLEDVSTEDMEELEDFIASFPDEEIPGTGVIAPVDLSILVAKAVDLFEERRQLSLWCRLEVMVKVEGDPFGEYRTFPLPLDSRLRGHIKKKYPDSQIMNDMFPAKPIEDQPIKKRPVGRPRKNDY